MEERTIVYSVVSKGGDPQGDQSLQKKLLDMAGVTKAQVSGREGRVVITGETLHPEQFTWALEQSGYEVLMVND